MVVLDNPFAGYLSEIADWRDLMEHSLRGDEGWLTLAGLHWLHEGSNSLGSDPNCDVVLPPGSTPEQLGSIEFSNGQARLNITADEPVTVDSESVRTALLRDDTAENGPSLVKVRAITFFVIKREDMYAIRVRDLNNPPRMTFQGRHWFPVDPAYRVHASFVPHPTPRTIQVVNSVGQISPMKNVGYAEFELHGQTFRLEAFDAAKNELWFIFKDATSGPTTYGAGRFLYAPRLADGSVLIDFNRAYHPPCSFTPFATCPLPPKENVLPVKVEAGEHL